MMRRSLRRHAARLGWQWVGPRLLRLVWRVLPLMIALAFALDQDAAAEQVTMTSRTPPTVRSPALRAWSSGPPHGRQASWRELNPSGAGSVASIDFVVRLVDQPR